MLKHSKLKWYKIETVSDFVEFLTFFEKFEEADIRTLIKLEKEYNKGSHHESKTVATEAIKVYGNIFNDQEKAVLKTEMLLSERNKEILNRLKSGKVVYINEMGGWNSAENYLEDEEGEWEPFDKDSFFQKFFSPGTENVLVLENDLKLPLEVSLYLEKMIGKNWEEKVNVITAFDIFKNTEAFSKTIKELIHKNTKIRLVFRTIDFNEERAEFLKPFLPFIQEIHSNQKEKIDAFFNHKVKTFAL